MKILVCLTCLNTFPAAWANGFLTSAIALVAYLSTQVCTIKSMHHKASSLPSWTFAPACIAPTPGINAVNV